MENWSLKSIEIRPARPPTTRSGCAVVLCFVATGLELGACWCLLVLGAWPAIRIALAITEHGWTSTNDMHREPSLDFQARIAQTMLKQRKSKHHQYAIICNSSVMFWGPARACYPLNRLSLQFGRIWRLSCGSSSQKRFRRHDCFKWLANTKFSHQIFSKPVSTFFQQTHKFPTQTARKQQHRRIMSWQSVCMQSTLAPFVLPLPRHAHENLISHTIHLMTSQSTNGAKRCQRISLLSIILTYFDRSSDVDRFANWHLPFVGWISCVSWV